ncbi:MAG: hypothetical protein H8E66_14090 [Planctomycetes bacterium]|nr:hypothetical protein [Planctomycetota bacterium]
MGRNLYWLLGLQLLLIASVAYAAEPPESADGRDRTQATPPTSANAPEANLKAWDDIPEGTELHGVSLYYGSYGKVPRRRLEQRPGIGLIHLDRPDKRVILFLSSYEPVIWDVRLEPGTTLEGIVLGGYNEQGVAERLVGMTRVIDASRQRPGRRKIPGTHGFMPSADVLAGKRIVEREPDLRFAHGRFLRPEEYRAYEQAQYDYYFCQIGRVLHELTDLDFASYVAVHEVQDETGILVAGAPLLVSPADQPQDGRER